ncbi:cupredoxin domain-containing protein [Effusibacillus pohliae]|uniref:cupredoxin domain-containing protein n=1 Tax=Effusibacillus pohliae TaxID=232270 RepID=UPI00036D382A|nr:cupredoxin domain-containing protein [Effusibacillus pohliae]
MKQHATWIAMAVVSLAVLAGCGGNQSAAIPDPTFTNEPQKAKIVGSNYKFEVTQGELKAGQPVTLTLEDQSGAHGFLITNTNINEKLKSGEQKTITWTPDKPGDYLVVCSVPCGSGHSSMQAKIVVK